MAFASTSTEFAMIDTRTTSGAFVLPLTSDIPGRIINIKDAYGTFTNSSLTVYTQGGEAFEDGTNFRILNNAWDQLQVYTASTTRWYITGGTEQNITTTNIGVFSTVQTFNWPSLCNTAGFGYGSTFNPTAIGRIALLDNVFTSSTAGLVSTFIEMGNLNAQPTIMSTGGAFRWLMGVEPDGASMGRGLQFKIKRWTSFGFSNSPIRYGANLSTLLDTVNIDSRGFVGINNSTPQYTLDVNGNAMLRSAVLINDGNQAGSNLFRNNYLYTQLFSSTLQVGFSNYAAALQMINIGGYNGASLPALLVGPSTPTQTSPILELFTPAANDNNLLRLGDPLGQLRFTAGLSYGGIRWTNTTGTLRGPQLYFGSNGIAINTTFVAPTTILDVGTQVASVSTIIRINAGSNGVASTSNVAAVRFDAVGGGGGLTSAFIKSQYNTIAGRYVLNFDVPNADNNNQFLTATDQYRFGVGCNNPQYTLDVNGQARFLGSTIITTTGASANGTARLILGPSPGGQNYDYCSLIQSCNNFANAGSELSFWTHGTSVNTGDPLRAMTINANQQVGINNTSPFSTLALDVNGLTRSRIFLSTVTTTSLTVLANSYGIYHNLTNTGFNQLTLTSLTGATSNQGWYVTLRNATTVAMSITVGSISCNNIPSPLAIGSSNSATLYWDGALFRVI